MKRLLSLFVAAAMLITPAAASDEKRDKTDTYTVIARYDFENDGFMQKFTPQRAAAQSVPTFGGRAFDASGEIFSPPGGSFVGSFSYAFDVFFPSLADGGYISLFDADGSAKLVFEPISDTAAKLYATCGDDASDLGTVLIGSRSKVAVSYDSESKNISISVGGNISADITAAQDIVFENIAFAFTQSFFIDDFCLSAALAAAERTPVIYRCGSLVAAQARDANSGAHMVLAAYSGDGRLVSVSSAAAADDGFLQTYMTADDKHAAYKAFVFGDALRPSQKNFEQGSASVWMSDIRLDGITYTKRGNTITATANSVADGVTSVVLEAVRDGCVAAKTSVSAAQFALHGASLGIGYVATGRYTLRLRAVVGGVYSLYYDGQSFCVGSNLSGSDYYVFAADSPMYIRNGDIKYFDSSDLMYVPQYADGDIYVLPETGGDIFGALPSDYGFNGGEVPLGDFADKLGCTVKFDTEQGLIYAAYGSIDDCEGYEQLFDDIAAEDDFEGDTLTWQGINQNWQFFNWATSSNSGVYGRESFDSSHGQSLYLGAAEKSFAGFQYAVIPLSADNDGYTVSLDAYAADGYRGNNLGIAFMMRGDNGFIRKVNANNVTSVKNGEWVRVTGSISKHQLSDESYTGFRLLIFTSAVSQNTGGRVYIDNVRLAAERHITKGVKSDIKCSKYASWYTLGETVSYTASFDTVSMFDSVTGIVYDSDGSEVASRTVSAYAFANGGWVYVPESPGYYEVAFFGKRSDGSVSPIVSYYSRVYNDTTGRFELGRKSFAVVKSSPKPLDERNKKFLVSTHALDEHDGKLADLIGFYGARIHWIRWGNSATVNGAHTARGKYDWKNVDRQFVNVQNAGLKVVAANIYGTPQWAVPDKYKNLTDYTIAGSIRYNNFAPENMSDLSDFVSEFIGRYGDRIEILEFWNEPNIGSTAFWGDSVENFAAMLKTAYTSVKSVNPKVEVSLGGIGNSASYTSFYNQLLGVGGIYDYYDLLAFHGSYDLDSKLNNTVAAFHGFLPKRWWNSEGYFSNYYVNGAAADKRDQAMAFASSFMQNLKAGAEHITNFQIKDLCGDEYRVFVNQNGGKISPFGLFRSYPDIEPKLSAVTAYNLFEQIKNGYDYIGEKRFAGVRAVSFGDENSAFIAFWSNEDFALPTELSALGQSISDMEGKTVSGASLKGGRMYYVSDVPSAKSKKLFGAASNSVLNTAMPAPYYNTEP